jgi:hypothetical protein
MYVEIDRFFIKEKLENGLLELSHVATGNQVADCSMKELSSMVSLFAMLHSFIPKNKPGKFRPITQPAKVDRIVMEDEVI